MAFRRKCVLMGCSLKSSNQHSAISCDPLPTEQRKRENEAEIGPDWSPEKRKKRLWPLGRQFGRIALWPLFSTKLYGGVGVVAEGRRQRAVGNCQNCQNRV